MIKLLRIDDRLIHGQVAFAWTRAIGVDCILVPNDAIVNDSFRKMSLNMAKPSGIKLIINNIKDSIEFLNSEKSKKLNIFVIVESIQDALTLSKGVNEIKEINVGGLRMKEDRKMITKAVAVDGKDIENLKELVSMGIDVEVRQVPTEKKKYIQDLLD